MFKVYKENKRLKKEIENLESSLEYYKNKDWIKLDGYTELLKKIKN